MSNSTLNHVGPVLGTFKPSPTNDCKVKLPENPANIADHMKYGLALDKLLEKAVVAGVADAKEVVGIDQKARLVRSPRCAASHLVVTILYEKAAYRPVQACESSARANRRVGRSDPDTYRGRATDRSHRRLLAPPHRDDVGFTGRTRSAFYVKRSTGRTRSPSDEERRTRRTQFGPPID